MLEAFEKQRSTVLDLLGKLTGLASRMGSSTMRDYIQINVVDKLASNQFRLVVVGEFNHGKTSLINALLDSDRLPVGVTPTTAVVHEIQYAKEPWAALLYESGEKKALPLDQLHFLAIGNPAPQPDPGPVRVLQIGCPSELLASQITIVDTPGVNDLSLMRADITYNYIPQCDAVVFVLDAGQPVKDSERAFLQDKLLGQSRDNIVFVMTKKDILQPNELETAVQYVTDQLKKLVDSPTVFAVSAEQALKGDRQASGIPSLVAYLTEFLQQYRGPIMLHNALGDGLATCQELEKGIDAKRRALQMDQHELTRRMEVIEQDLQGQQHTMQQRREFLREQITAIKAWVKRDLDAFVGDVCEQIPAIVDEANTSDLKAHLGAFLEGTFQHWAQKQVQEIGEEIEKLSEKMIAMASEDARLAGQRMAKWLGSEIETPRIEVNGLGYGIGVAALLGVGLRVVFSNLMLGSVMLVAAPVLAAYARGKAAEQAKQKAKKAAPEAIRKAADSVAPKFEQLIDDYANSLDEWVQTSGKQVHQQVLEMLQQAQLHREQGEKAQREALQACAELLHELQSVQRQIVDMRQAIAKRLS